MRLSLTILVLTGFVLKQFSCCEESCAPCAQADDANVAQPVGPGHSHDHPHEHESPAPGGGSHHLCVATHLFYVTHENKLPRLPGFSVWVAACLLGDASLVRISANSSNTALDFHTLQPPRAALRLRAKLNVWVI